MLRKETLMRRHSFSALAFALACGAAFAACGGKSNAQSGLGTDTTPPPPPTGTGGGDSTGPSRVVSKDAAADFAAAADYFTKQEAAGWTSSSCETAAKKFAGVADDHRTIIEARYMQGLSYHRCNMAAPAEAAYQATIKADPNYAMAESNLGELYFAAGKRDAAKQYWDSAVKKMPKLTGARINLASLLLEDMRTTTDATKWAALDEEARKHLSSSLAVDNENVRAYTVYALVYMEGRAKNKNRLDLAKVMIDEGLKRSDKFAPLKNAFGLWYMTKNNLTAALTQFQAAVSLDPKFVEARMNVGLINLGVRKFATPRPSSPPYSRWTPRTTTPTSAWALRSAACSISMPPRPATTRPRPSTRRVATRCSTWVCCTSRSRLPRPATPGASRPPRQPTRRPRSTSSSSWR
jgi:Tfp pilus assembly protein PilF